MVFTWDKVQAFINPTIRCYFASNAKGTDIAEDKKQTFEMAEQNITSRIKFYIPCVSQTASDFIHIFAAFFDYLFIGEANEKNDVSYSQITENYKQAIEWLEKHGGDYCAKHIQQRDVARLTDFMDFESRVGEKFL